ncbi:hypothetical protein C0J52_02004 [Blattella germanica]|nr:hypothetical protein C0J52_02004 [Blattella germanica]
MYRNITLCKDVSLLVTERIKDVEKAATQYTPLIVFNTGKTKLLFNDTTLAILICSLWLTTDAPCGMQLSTPWARQKGTFLAPKPQPLSRAILIYLPLECWTWVALLSVCIIFSLVLHIVGRLLPTQNRYRSIRLCFLNTFRTLMLNGVPGFPTQVSLRWLLVGWSFFSLLTTTVYSSGYTSLLTSPLYSPPIDTLGDLLEQGIYWGEESENTFAYLIRESGNSKLIEFGNRFKRELTPRDRENRILKGNYAIFSKVMASAFVTETERLSQRARRMLRVMEEPVFTFYVGIGLRTNSPYETVIDSTIVRLHGAGLLEFWQRLIIQKLGYRYMNTFFTLQIDDDNIHALTLNSVLGAFSLLGVGLVIASVVYVVEITTRGGRRECGGLSAALSIGVPVSTAHRWVQLSREGVEHHRPGSGRRRISTPEQNAALVAEAVRNPFQSVSAIRTNSQLPGSTETAQWHLKDEQLFARIAAKKELLKDEHKLFRLAFAEENINRN